MCDLTGRSTDDDSSLESVNYAPATFCPVNSVCLEIISPSDFLGHFLLQHKEQLNCSIREAFNGEKVITTINLNDCIFGKNHCISAVAYGGDRDKPDTRPVNKGLCLKNADISPNYDKYKNHALIAFIICKTHCAAMLSDKQMQKQLMKPHDTERHLYIIWAVSSGLTDRLYTTISVFNNEMNESRGVTQCVRDYHESQNPCDFLGKCAGYMLLTHGDVKRLTSESDGVLCVETIVHEQLSLGVH